MKTHAILLLSFLVCQISALTANDVPKKLRDISALLQPQRDLQINLRIPDYYYAKVPRISEALSHSVDFLVSHELPFRLFYNNSERLLGPELALRPSRHVRNQLVWLVFVIVGSKSEILNTFQAVQGCSFGTELGWSALIHKDWVQLIVDDWDIGQSWDGRWRLNINRAFLPLNFITIYWRRFNFSGKHAVYIFRETCMCDDMSPVVPLRKFFGILTKPHGMERIGREIRRLKGDFRGRRIHVLPRMWAFGSWESKWKYVLSAYSLREARRRSWHVAFVGIFDPFIALHNFTFDTIGAEEQAALIRNSTATMSMAIKFENNGVQVHSPTVNLHGFNHYHSYYFTTTTQPDPARLSSLMAPFSDLAGALLLLTLSALTTTMLLMALGARRCFWDTPETVLLVVSGLIGHSWSTNGNSRFLLFYICWLFLAGFISIMYTNILQSVVVVPGIRFNRLTFEEMVHRKYTFESLAVKPLKS